MNRIRAAIFAAFLAIPCLSHAETVELVTYFPAGGGAGEENPQMDTLRVGNAYENLPIPADGTAVIAGSLGIGIPVPANGTIAPAADLHIVDEGNDAELVLQRFVGNALNSEVLLAAQQGRGVLDAAGTLSLGTNGNARLLIYPSAGNIGIGNEALFPLGALAPLHVNVAGPNTTPLLLEGFYNTADPLFLMFRRTVGTPDNRQAIRNNDGLGELLFQGSTGAGPNDLATGARIRAEAAGAWANNSAPTDLLFFTSGTAGGGERMRIAAAGNVGIGTDAPDPAAALELSFTNNNPVGFLPPRMTTGQRDSIAAPPEGLTIYNTTTRRMEVRTNTAWVPVGLPALVFAQGTGVVSGTNNAINETATFNITLPAGTWVVQAHAQIDQKNTPALSFRINGVQVQTTPDSGTGRDLVLVFGVRQVTVAAPGPSVIPVTLVATTNAGLKEESPVNFMIIATQVG